MPCPYPCPDPFWLYQERPEDYEGDDYWRVTCRGCDFDSGWREPLDAMDAYEAAHQ